MPLRATPDAIVPALQSLFASPDLILLVDVDQDVALAVASAFGMQQSFHPQLLQRTTASPGRIASVCILSTRGLYEASGRSVDRRTTGVSARLLDAGRWFEIRCILAETQADVPVDIDPHPRGAVGPPPVLEAGRIGGNLVLRMASKPAATQAATAGELRELIRPADLHAVVFTIGGGNGRAGL